MKTILISIHPEHVKNIFEGIKTFEYRRKLANSDVNKMVIYATAPVSKVVGEVEIIKKVVDSPNNLWELTKEKSGIEKPFFEKYFGDLLFASAYQLGKVTIYQIPKTLKDFDLKVAPRSFVYLKN